MPDLPQLLAFPPRVIGGRLLEDEQGSADDAISQIRLLILTPQGWLDSERDFGLYDQAHLSGGADEAEIERQLTTYVPDADLAVQERADELNAALSIVGVQLRTGA